MERSDARCEIRWWIDDELHLYADGKWDRDDPHHNEWDEETARWWQEFFEQYIHRAFLLDLTTPLGKQALLKSLTTLFEMCVTMVVAEGVRDVPAPGYPSGEIH